MEQMYNQQLLFDSIVGGKMETSVQAATDAIEGGVEAGQIVSECMIKAMEEIGRRFEEGKAYVPHLLMAARAMKAALEVVKPHMSGEASPAAGKIIIGTVFGDLHDIGKNLVASMFEGCGFEVINLGTNVSADRFVAAAKEHHADIVCLSALLTTTMTYMETVVKAFEAAGIRDQVKIMVGGAPVTQNYADRIGADAYTDNANAAVTVAKELLSAI